MFGAAELFKNTEKLISEGKLSEAELYLNKSLSEAMDAGDNNLVLTILNEQAGFYRDCGKMQKAIDCCISSEKLMDKMGIGETSERASAYLNTANAYRASGDLDDAYSYYKKAYSIIEKYGDDTLYASYYNNMSLLHQEAGKYTEAAECLKKALYIVEDKLGDEIKAAITRTNLASTLLRLKRIEEARECLLPAIAIFSGRTPSDFHYSAALSAMADLCLLCGRFEESVNYFEMALSEIKLHMGENNFYKIVEDNLDKAMDLLVRKKELDGEEGITKAILRNPKGLELCRRYFKAFGEPVITKNFNHLLNDIACGMAGDGSECLGYDDDISGDHDFGPGFCIWINDNVSDEDAKRLSKMYELLPKTFMGKTRIETAEGVGRVGVIRIKDYIKKATGFDHMPKGPAEWQYTVDENLITFINGNVFMDKSGFLDSMRLYIQTQQPMFVYCGKLSMQLELMHKHGQYSYERALKRNDYTAAFIAKSEFLKATMRCVNIISRKYAPYAKWLRKSLDELKGFEGLTILIDELSVSAVSEKDIEKIEAICQIVNAQLKLRGLSDNKESYLKVAARDIVDLANRSLIADQIVDIEWNLFDKTKNTGGRANCQDDWGTFSIMRRSQYYTWPEKLLKTLLADYSEALKNGRNVITEKYGYMMESTVPDEFAKIKDMLPKVNSDKKQVMEAIIKFQIEWMEDFSNRYPKLAANARSIHTCEDTPYNTSYETYLRGELSTYHDDTLLLYGRFIAELKSKGENLAEKIMKNTVFFYGFMNLDDAEGK